MEMSWTYIDDRLDSALVEAQFGWLGKDYVNISNLSAGSADNQYPWQLSKILKLLGMHHNPKWTYPLGSLSDIFIRVIVSHVL